MAKVSCIIKISPSPTSSTTKNQDDKISIRNVWMHPHLAARETQGPRGVCTFSSRTAPKRNGRATTIS